MSKTTQLNIHIGALAPTISAQLKKQGLKFNPEKVKQIQKSLHCITHLFFDDILSDAQAKKAYDKLFTQIKKHVKTQNK